MGKLTTAQIGEDTLTLVHTGAEEPLSTIRFGEEGEPELTTHAIGEEDGSTMPMGEEDGPVLVTGRRGEDELSPVHPGIDPFGGF